MAGRSADVPGGRRIPLRRAASVAFLATVALFVTITLLGSPLRNAVAPLGIVSLQFAANPTAAEAILASWSGVPRARLLWAHGLDLILPVAYALAIGLLATDRATGSPRAASAAHLAAGAAVMAAIADQIENVAMFVTILLRPSWFTVLPTRAAAAVKSILLVLALGALLVASIRAQRTRRTGERR
jgi:hypothetical protein